MKRKSTQKTNPIEKYNYDDITLDFLDFINDDPLLPIDEIHFGENTISFIDVTETHIGIKINYDVHRHAITEASTLLCMSRMSSGIDALGSDSTPTDIFELAFGELLYILYRFHNYRHGRDISIDLNLPPHFFDNLEVLGFGDNADEITKMINSSGTPRTKNNNKKKKGKAPTEDDEEDDNNYPSSRFHRCDA